MLPGHRHILVQRPAIRLSCLTPHHDQSALIHNLPPSGPVCHRDRRKLVGLEDNISIMLEQDPG